MAYVARPSIQEFEVPAPIEEPAIRYFEWVDTHVPGVRVERSADVVQMFIIGMAQPAIALRAAPTVDGAEAYEVTGGVLVGDPAGGMFVFEEPTPTRLRISLEGFTPRLPRFVYVITHALVHEYVMWSFRRYTTIPRLEVM